MTLEDQLRDAFAARTAEVRPPAEPDWAPVGRHPRRMLPPVLATTAALLVLIAALFARPTPDRPPAIAEFPPTAPVTAVAAAESPEFVFRIRALDGMGKKGDAEIMDLALARIIGVVTPPTGFPYFSGQAAAASDNRTFFFSVMAKPGGRLYVAEVHLDQNGRPGPARVVAMHPETRVSGLLAASPDATRLALAMEPRPDKIVVWDLRTGHGRVWTVAAYLNGLSWTADNRHLRWSGGTGIGPAYRSLTGTLDTEAGGTDLRRTDAMAGTAPPASPQGGPPPSALLPDGGQVTVSARGGSAELALVSATDDRHVLDTWTDRQGMPPKPIIDGAGRHVLYARDRGWASLDLGNGRHRPTRLPVHQATGYSYVW
jgi:hypothetical protein